MPESIYSCNYTNIFHLVMLRRCTRGAVPLLSGTVVDDWFRPAAASNVTIVTVTGDQ